MSKESESPPSEHQVEDGQSVEADFIESFSHGVKEAADRMLQATGRFTKRVPAQGSGEGGLDLGRVAERIASTAASLLGVDRVAPDDDIFNLGGTSVTAVELIAVLSRDFGLKLNLDDLFADPRPRRLAERALRKAGVLPTVSLEAASAPVSVGMPEGTAVEMLDQDGIEDLQAIQQDLALADRLPWIEEPVRRVPTRILLTGATGYLGGYILFDLLRYSDAHVVCLVRGKDDENAKIRLAKALHELELPWSTEIERRVTVVAGDLQAPRLGWNEERWDTLANEVDSVVGVAAEVDFMRGYRSLRATNVLGPVTLADFAATGRSKPFHHVSSVAIFDEVNIRAIGEEERPAHLHRLHAGYDKTKWVAEAALRRAREHGMTVSFLRPGGIASHSETGVYNTNDLYSAVLPAAMLVGAMPALRYSTVAPVDWVSRVVATVVCDPDAWGYNYNLFGQPMTAAEVLRGTALAGFPLKMTSLEAWRDLFLARMEADPLPALDHLTRVLRHPPAFKLLEAVFSAPVSRQDRTDALVRRHKLPTPSKLDPRPTMRLMERLHADGRVQLPGRDGLPMLWFAERMEGSLAAPGEPAADCTFRFRISVGTMVQVVLDRRLDVTGKVSCALLHSEPLEVVAGDCWVRPDGSVPLQHGEAHPLLRYRLVLESTSGERWWVLGEKTARPGLNLYEQSRTAQVSIGREGAPASFEGTMVVPSASYIPDQVDGIEVNPAFAKAQQRIVKYGWLAWFAGQFGLGFMDPALRVATEVIEALIDPASKELGQ